MWHVTMTKWLFLFLFFIRPYFFPKCIIFLNMIFSKLQIARLQKTDIFLGRRVFNTLFQEFFPTFAEKTFRQQLLIHLIFVGNYLYPAFFSTWKYWLTAYFTVEYSTSLHPLNTSTYNWLRKMILTILSYNLRFS